MGSGGNHGDVPYVWMRDIADVAAEMSGKGGLGYETSKYDS